MPLQHTVHELILNNGVKGLIIDVPGSTVVNYKIGFKGSGNKFVNPMIQQTPHLVEHLLAGGPSQKYSNINDFVQDYRKNGAYSNAFTGDNSVVFVAESSITEWDRILDIMQLMITKPVFNSDLINSEKLTIKDELTSYMNKNGMVIYKYIKMAMGIPGAVELEKSIKSLDAIKLPDIQQYYKSKYNLKNMRFVLVGDLIRKKEQIISKFQLWDLPSGESLDIKKIVLKKSSSVKVFRDIANLSYVLQICLNRVITRKENAAMDIINYILTKTHSSRIFGEARKRGLCYSINSSTFTEPSNYSYWGFNGEIKNENLNELLQLITDQLRILIIDGINEEELEKAKQFLLGDHNRRYQTADNLNEWYSLDYFCFDEINNLDKKPDFLRSITVDEINIIISEFINNNTWYFGVIGNVTDDDFNHYQDIISKLFIIE